MSKQYRVKCRETDQLCRGLVTFNNSIFAIDGLLDGETAKIELVYGKDRRSTTAKLASLEEPSPFRQEPFCKAFGRCGGCQLQYASYEKQLALKKAAVADGKIEWADMSDAMFKSRKTMEITEVVGYKDGQVILNPLYVFEEDEKSTLEKVSGSLNRTENKMQNVFKLQLSGIKTEI